MRVTFRTNLGSIDAKTLNLDHTKCKVGETVDVDKGVGEKLIEQGIAVAAEDAKGDELIESAQDMEHERRAPPVPPIRAVPPKPSLTAPEKAEK